MNIYAGIGSRSTPDDTIGLMADLAYDLAKAGWMLRSGFADGADQAFEAGSNLVPGTKEIYLPWAGFNGSQNHHGHIVPEFTTLMMNIAAYHHPNWGACTAGAKKLHARNVAQVLGSDCRTPAKMVVCWTPGGRGEGGTGQAIRIAKAYGIPVFDLAIEGKLAELITFANNL